MAAGVLARSSPRCFVLMSGMLAVTTSSLRVTAKSAFRASAVRCFALPTAEEMMPGSNEMKARAQGARAKYPDRILSPLEATLFAIEQRAKIVDVRTAAERSTHEINGRKGVAIRGAISLPLNDLVSSKVSVPSGPLLLVCSKGPKSLVALDYFLGEVGCEDEVKVVDGGTTAWDSEGLPTENVGAA
ncbi:hypothetical protein T492DRAFT_1090796 [Pavlovales sp. CCMP2436]|nr:hypothetical protein T492DRAFT_1090796 [Pavlovales sp. CCMP2436]|mmetsp:Transcript_44626/g.110635  ORF Transcript_44626/g.110635 Transcript_44626/m.110635 type:complete len:187 (+) Transcript_44626:59-619(+)